MAEPDRSDPLPRAPAHDPPSPTVELKRPGWSKIEGKWIPDAMLRKPAPNVPLGAFATDLEASHVRITRALAVATRRLELAAPAGLSPEDLDALEQLARVWRTLEANVEKLAEKAIEKAIKHELKRLGPEGAIVGGAAVDEADSPGE